MYTKKLHIKLIKIWFEKITRSLKILKERERRKIMTTGLKQKLSVHVHVQYSSVLKEIFRSFRHYS